MTAPATRRSPGPFSAFALGPVAVLLALLTLAVSIVGGLPFDGPVHDWFAANRAAPLTEAARLLTDSAVGVPALLLAAAAGALLAGRAELRHRARYAAAAIGVLLAGRLVRYACAELLNRARPEQTDWAVPAFGHAFPSGHTAGATIIAVLFVAALRGTGPRALVVGWALGVGLTRVYLGVHWPTDVLAGFCFGVLWTVPCLWLLRRGSVRDEAREAA
ncbi:undecaprenyl-diphosphatase [Actinocorallia herbida]|uniref:Undecaprenyl-diphosphatase n=1 Tax=Actinocorallia herbida TaxID=58109 RepID=A0A3N1CXV1_9ACTN|nr:phosphatase PAP2 family protein [Actinocorallia herbida]ROO86119.1 undecaprenyl-diphosphatase [Actinocorallia herbida]